MEIPQVTFKSIGSLLSDGISPAAVATEIERNGAFGWDRYGGFGKFDKGDARAKAALDCIADEYASRGQDRGSPIDWDDFDTPFSLCGWPEDKLPDFQVIETARPKMLRPHDIAKTENSNLAIIAALLMFIKGNLGGVAHPAYQSEEVLIGLIAEKMDYPGTKTRTLQDRFKDAKRFFPLTT